MIELFQYSPAFNLPSPSPFCMKLETLLKMGGIPYSNRYDADVRKAPKAKLPYIVVDGSTTIADSELIRLHLERTGELNVDEWLTDLQKAQSVAVTRLVEEHLYWLIVESRWLNEQFWPALRDEFFSPLPPVVKSIVPRLVRKQVVRTLYGQGLGRHGRAELEQFAEADLNALETLLGDAAFMMGDRVATVDATVYAALASIYFPGIDTPLKEMARRHSNLLAYCERMTKQFFPDYCPT